MADSLEHREALLPLLADGAREIALRFFQCEELGVAEKADASPVTQADHAIEEFLRSTIHTHFPNDALLGEEFGEASGASGYRWILDPIDGTVSFANGVPLFGILIALARCTQDGQDEVIAGIADFPALGERIMASRGRGALWMRDDKSPKVARVRTGVRARDAVICTSGSEYYFKANRVDALLRVARAVGRLRGWSDCYGLLLVATGRANAMIEPIMRPWDIGPFAVILPEAGGTLTDWTGMARIDGGNAIAAEPVLAHELRALLQD